jgi:ATP phosphoribosyltransferase regulatory subunit
MTNLEPVAPPPALAAIRAPFLTQGATLTDVPVMQPLGLLLDLVGEGVRERLFTVQADGIEEACLRPDFTIPVARAHILSGARTGRYLYEGKAFRVAPAGSDRAEEFLQIGLEVYEAGETPRLDADIAVLGLDAARAGGRDDLTVRLGDIGLFAAFVRALDLAPSLSGRLQRAFLRPRELKALLERAESAPVAGAADGDRLPQLLSTLPEEEAAAVLKEMWALAGIQPVGGRSAAEIVHRLAMRAEDGALPSLSLGEAGLIHRYLAVADRPRQALDAVAALAREAGSDLDGAIDGWWSRLQAMQAGGMSLDRMTFATSFGREFGYYDGFLFEVRSEALGADAPVAAGGRYDSLLQRLTYSGAMQNPGVPYAELVKRVDDARAVGCMVRPWRAFVGGQA